MNLQEFVINECPKRCGVHLSNSRVAELIYIAELEGDENFSSDKFDSVRDRCLLALPYFPANQDAYFNCLDVIELCALYDGQIRKGIDSQERINELENFRDFDEVERLVIKTEVEKLKSNEKST